MTIPAPPPDSAFEIDAATESVRWRPPNNGGMLRIAIMFFLIFWLCGWMFGEVMVTHQILHAKHGGADVFLIVWLGGWTIGGVFAGTMAVRIARGATPDVLRFEPSKVVFSQGRRSFNPMLFSSAMTIQEQQARFWRIFSKRRSYEILRNAPGSFRLERVGERQRLTIDISSDRVEIGEDLREPEREWLFNVLSQWKSVGA